MDCVRTYQLIHRARERAGISIEEIAPRVGLTASEYFDLEAHPDEFIAVIAMIEARALCRKRGLRLVDVVASEVSDADLFAGHRTVQVTSPRSVFLRQRRESLGVSLAEMAFAIGFEDAAIEQIERDDLYLDTLALSWSS